MSFLDWADSLQTPLGVVLGVAGTKLFDRRKDQATVGKTTSEQNKLDAEAIKTIVDAAVALVAPTKKEMQELRGRVDALEAENASTKYKLSSAFDYIRRLHSWIREHMPDKTPPSPPIELDLTLNGG